MKTFSLKQNPIQTILGFCFFILCHLYFSSLSVPHPCSSMPPSVPTFPEKAFRSVSSHCASFPSFFISLCPSCSLLTANAAPLMGAISSLNTCRCLQHFGRDGGRKRDGNKERHKKRESSGWCCSGPLRHDI